jgi:hypothetical protein
MSRPSFVSHYFSFFACFSGVFCVFFTLAGTRLSKFYKKEMVHSLLKIYWHQVWNELEEAHEAASEDRLIREAASKKARGRKDTIPTALQ